MGAGCDAEACDLGGPNSLPTGKRTGNLEILGRIAPKAAEKLTSFQALASKFPVQCAVRTGNQFGRTGDSFRLILGEQGFSGSCGDESLCGPIPSKRNLIELHGLRAPKSHFGGLPGAFPGRPLCAISKAAILARRERRRFAFPANPKIGRPGRVLGTRELVISQTLTIVPYLLPEGTIEVLRVFHGARRRPDRL